MLAHNELKKGSKIILDGQPYEILDLNLMKKAQRRVVIQTKLRNLITNNVLDRNFHQGDVFEEAEMIKLNVKFLYCHKERCFFSEETEPSKRFDLDIEQIGSQAKFLKANQIIEAMIFNEKVINVALPIKVKLKITEAPPGVKGDRAQGGNKTVVLETGAKVAVPLFIKQGDIIEINTETGEYVKRAE
ncbi:MAG: elongation factor P [Candidatus Nealsonbacteria bacterium]|nr:elongation factor P [Candidatus Nealsonbacteria bacterium]